MGKSRDVDTVDGNCIKCNKRTRHAIRVGKNNAEYFECARCGNKVDLKAFVFDNLDALSKDSGLGDPGRA